MCANSRVRRLMFSKKEVIGKKYHDSRNFSIGGRIEFGKRQSKEANCE